MTRTRTVVAVVVTALILPVTAGATAQPATETTSPLGDGMVIATADAYRGWRIGQPAPTQTRHVGSDPLSPEQRSKAIGGSRQIVVTEVDDDIGTTAGPIDDPVSVAECRDQWADQPAYWFKNRFAACRVHQFSIGYTRNGVIVGGELLDGTLIGNAGAGVATVDLTMAIQRVSAFGESFAYTARLGLRVSCANNDPSRTSACTVTPVGGVEHTVAAWVGGATADIDLSTTTTAVPPGKHAPELRGVFQLTPELQLSGTGSPDVGVQPLPDDFLRCDVAGYVTGSRCVFERATATLQFSASDPAIAESAQFIRDAQQDITRTAPGLVGTSVPGRYPGGQPLTRLYSGYDTAKLVPASRRKVRATCRRFFGAGYTTGPGGVQRQCDEYPFAATYENSATVNGNAARGYAVRAITASHNEEAGRRFGLWLSQDHILDEDEFFVVIRD